MIYAQLESQIKKPFPLHIQIAAGKKPSKVRARNFSRPLWTEQEMQIMHFELTASKWEGGGGGWWGGVAQRFKLHLIEPQNSVRVSPSHHP